VETRTGWPVVTRTGWPGLTLQPEAQAATRVSCAGETGSMA
jgi:hypothetical protein